MSDIIPDPIDPLMGALDSGGRLMGAVFVAPVGTPPDEMRKPENHVGYSHGINADDETPLQPEG